MKYHQNDDISISVYKLIEVNEIWSIAWTDRKYESQSPVTYSYRKED